MGCYTGSQSLSLSLFGVASGPECERIELSKDRQIKQLLTNVDCCCWCTYLPNVIFISLRRWKLLLPVLEWGRQDGSWIKKVDRFRVTATVVGKERERETERTWRLKEHQHGASKRASKQARLRARLSSPVRTAVIWEPQMNSSQCLEFLESSLLQPICYGIVLNGF